MIIFSHQCIVDNKKQLHLQVHEHRYVDVYNITTTFKLAMRPTNGIRFLLPHDAIHKRSLCRHTVFICLFVRLSVCPYLAFVNSVQTNSRILRLFFHSRVRQTILVLYTKPYGDIPTGTSLMGRRMQVG